MTPPPLPADVPWPPELLTPRLLLRPPRRGDGPALYEAIAETLDDLRRQVTSLPWAAAEQTAASAELYCRDCEPRVAERADLPLLAFERDSGRLALCCGLHRLDWATPKGEIGYWCRLGARGRGLVHEAVTAVTDWGFGTLGLARIAIVTDAANRASRRVAERAGFRLEGLLRHERRGPDGVLHDTCLYGRLADTPPPPHR